MEENVGIKGEEVAVDVGSGEKRKLADGEAAAVVEASESKGEGLVQVSRLPEGKNKSSNTEVAVKPDLNTECKDESEEDNEEVVVLGATKNKLDSPSNSKKSLEKTQPSVIAAAKDDLLLTLGGSWGSFHKKPGVEEIMTKDKNPGKAQATGDLISLSLGSSAGNPPSASVLSGKAATGSVRSISNTTTVSPGNTRSFVHNPSCSLTHNSLEELNSSATQYVAGQENETVSHGGLFANEQLFQRARNEASEHRAILPMNGVVQQAPAAAAAAANTAAGRNSAVANNVITKWNSYNLEKYHALFPDLKEGFRAKYAGSRRSKSHRTDEAGRSHSGENRVGLYEIAADPVAAVAHKLQELPDIFLEDLKKSLTDMLSSVEKRDEFLRLQRILQQRTDLTAETLYLAHRTQLELLVAMKTGIQAFLLRENPLTTSALVEVFMQKRCRNFACQNQLPVDDCDCQFCSQKEGFCSACMCIACSKFDFMSNTCRWVGCDFCLHWCHTDCGIRLSYIKPGTVQGGKPGQFEMQFVCVACGHASDLFGFVREVFTTYSKDWNPQTLKQELDCIQRIFRRSQDFRGKQLCWIAERMLAKVEGDTSEICETLTSFFQEGKVDLEKANANQKHKEPGRASEAVIPARPGSYTNSEEIAKKMSGNSLQNLDRELEAKRNEIAEMQYSRARKRSEIEEMESLIHIKQAEAKMFQLRADEARLEAERLKKIVVAKSEKIEEEYVSKGYKLHVNDAVEKRKRCFVEYQMLEQGLQDFSSMKAKLVTDVHDVLRKMDMMKRSRMFQGS